MSAEAAGFCPDHWERLPCPACARDNRAVLVAGIVSVILGFVGAWLLWR